MSNRCVCFGAQREEIVDLGKVHLRFDHANPSQLGNFSPSKPTRSSHASFLATLINIPPTVQHTFTTARTAPQLSSARLRGFKHCAGPTSGSSEPSSIAVGLRTVWERDTQRETQSCSLHLPGRGMQDPQLHAQVLALVLLARQTVPRALERPSLAATMPFPRPRSCLHPPFAAPST